MREAVVQVEPNLGDDFGMGAFMLLFDTAGLWSISELLCIGAGGIFFVMVERQLDETRLAELDFVEIIEVIDPPGAGMTYLLEIEVPAFPASLPSHHELGLVDWELAPVEDGVDISLVGRQDGIGRLLRRYEQFGLRPSLKSLVNHRGPKTLLSCLTSRQREVIMTAFENGYFEVPRATTASEVGRLLGLDGSTVSEHLQRAQRNLMIEILGSSQARTFVKSQ